ncbi:hypothetical protein NMY22_g16885 [Coprinellus aureogranulatus]|nr:hypothetical protein NMY22_g16885 [Coprinellus aureogranulatus]
MKGRSPKHIRELKPARRLDPTDTTRLKESVAAYILARELRDAEEQQSRRDGLVDEARGADDTERGKASTGRHMRPIFALLYHAIVFDRCLSKSAIQGRLEKLDNDNGLDETYPDHRPSVQSVAELPEVLEPGWFLGDREHPTSQYRAVYYIDVKTTVNSSFLESMDPVSKLHHHVFSLQVTGSSLSCCKIAIHSPWTFRKHCLFIIAGDTFPPEAPISGEIVGDSRRKSCSWTVRFPSRILDVLGRGRTGIRIVMVLTLGENAIFANQLMSTIVQDAYPITHVQIAFTLNESDRDFPATLIQGPISLRKGQAVSHVVHWANSRSHALTAQVQYDSRTADAQSSAESEKSERGTAPGVGFPRELEAQCLTATTQTKQPILENVVNDAGSATLSAESNSQHSHPHLHPGHQVEVEGILSVSNATPFMVRLTLFAEFFFVPTNTDFDSHAVDIENGFEPEGMVFVEAEYSATAPHLYYEPFPCDQGAFPPADPFPNLSDGITNFPTSSILEDDHHGYGDGQSQSLWLTVLEEGGFTDCQPYYYTPTGLAIGFGSA